jgi:hypothetical protein
VLQPQFGNLEISGGTEDGYDAINFALGAFNYTPGAAINHVLVSDGDRDNTSVDTYASIFASSIFASLSSRNILLNAIVTNPFTSDNNASGVLGVDGSGDAHVADGSGGFTTDTGSTVGNGAGTTETDYIALALATGGAAWNLNPLRAGGNLADSFSASFIDITVGEITMQPTSPVPLPAAGWMLLAGVGGLAALRRRQKRNDA